jgi:hypothetical protein
MRLGSLEWSEWRQAISARLLQAPMCLIYQMPKAGSQTVEATLRPLLPSYEISRLHFYSRGGVEIFRGLAELPSMPQWMRENLLHQCRLGHVMRRAVTIRRFLKPWRLRSHKIEVITAVREPVGLMLSWFFQFHPFYFPDGKRMDAENCKALLTSSRSIDSDRRQATALMEKFIGDWFDRELKETVGIDVFGTPFNHEKGYSIYENAHSRVLVYRFENINSLDTMLGEFFRIAKPQIINQNIGSAKQYAEAYKEVRDRLCPSADFLKEQYNVRFVKHFYSPEEQEKLIRQWQTPASMKGAGSQLRGQDADLTFVPLQSLRKSKS